MRGRVLSASRYPTPLHSTKRPGPGTALARNGGGEIWAAQRPSARSDTERAGRLRHLVTTHRRAGEVLTAVSRVSQATDPGSEGQAYRIGSRRRRVYVRESMTIRMGSDGWAHRPARTLVWSSSTLGHSRVPRADSGEKGPRVRRQGPGRARWAMSQRESVSERALARFRVRVSRRLGDVVRDLDRVWLLGGDVG